MTIKQIRIYTRIIYMLEPNSLYQQESEFASIMREKGKRFDNLNLEVVVLLSS